MDSSKKEYADSSESVISSSPDIISPGGKSRYGRTRRPKVTQDFYHIDSVVIDETPASPMKSPKIKSPVKPPAIGREILFELKDEFTKLDDLGMKVANNFKTNLQRGLDDSIKERKFFKAAPESKADVANVVDVTKVFKLISTKPALVSDVCKKASPKTTLKTYSNKRKHVPVSESFVVESFGLPDEPIIPVNSPVTVERDTKIDVDLNVDNDVTLPSPWIFDFQNGPVCFADPAEEFAEANFRRSRSLDLFSCDSRISENTDVDNASDITSTCLEKPQTKAASVKKVAKKVFEFITTNRRDSLRSRNVSKNDSRIIEEIVDENVKCDKVDKSESETGGTRTTVDGNKDVAKGIKKSFEAISKQIIEEAEKVKKKSSPVHNEKVTEEIEKTSHKTEEKKSFVNKKIIEEIKKKLSPVAELPTFQESKRVLRSNTDSSIDCNKTEDSVEDLPIGRSLRSTKIVDLTGPSPTPSADSSIEIKSEEDTSINQRSLRSKKVIDLTSPPTPPIKIRPSKEVINPVNLSKIICHSQVRVILNPLACLEHLPRKIADDKSPAPNPVKVKKLKKERFKTVFDHRRKLRSKSSAKIDPEIEIKEESQDGEINIKDIKTEIIDYSVGDLAWAKIGTHPYWPCMITEDPFYGHHRRSFSNRQHFHVRFFGDRGRRSWVSSSKLMLYCGKDDLDNLAKILKAENKVKMALITESYVVKPSKLAKWQVGIDEAESLKTKSVEERLDYFFDLFASKREKQRRLKELGIKEEIADPEYSDSKSKKRKRVLDDAVIEPKKIKRSLSSDEVLDGGEEAQKKTKGKHLSPEGRKKIKRMSQSVEEVEEIQASPKKNKKASEETRSLKKIRSPIKLRKSQGNGEKVKEEEEEPQAKAKDDAEENQFEDARKKLRNYQMKPEEETEEEDSGSKLRNKRHMMPSEYSNSDTDSKFSDNSSVPASLQSQAAFYRRNNIFRGIPREKVCQICEKPGEVFKCKGPCNGVYHYNCAMSAETKEEEEKVEKKPETKPEQAVPECRSNVEIIAVNSKKPLPDLSTSPNFKGMSLAEKIDFRMKEIMKKFDYQSVYSESTDSSGGEELLMDESFEKIENHQNSSKLSLTITTSPSKKEVPIIKHVTADNINYICVTNEKPKDKEVTELIKDTLKHLRCTWCSAGEISKCLVCTEEESKEGSKFRQKCSLHQCGKYYHPECLKTWPQTQWSLIQRTKDKKSDASYDTFVCPRHVCHTCISDDPRAANSRCPSGKVVKCLRCPATYHSSNYCVPAGTHILTSTQIVCPRHYQKTGKKRHFQQTINTNWCFICSKGGDLICCETCPTSVHAECMPGYLTEDDTFFCEDCQSGRLPLYDEIVWVKLGTFRWWPALILFPNEIPDNVRNVTHNMGEFVVKFFGTYDHYWVGRGRTFLFQEGDKGHSNSARKKVDTNFIKAIEEAAAAHHLKKQFKTKVAEKNSGLKPPHYIRIKVNKPVGNVRQFDGNNSNTTSCDCDPHQPHPCGPESDCLNRLLLTECNPDVCPAGDRCNNQCFEKREYPPLVPHHTRERGWGLKTLAPIRKGQFVIEYVGEMIDEQEYQRRVQKMHEQKEENYYFLTIDKDRMLDAGPKGNVARFMNHSCQPNCETQKWTVNGDTRVGLFANCDIPADTELTFNYNLECIGKEKKICRCGEAICSGFIGVKVKAPVVLQKKANNKPKKKKSLPPVSDVVVNENPCFVCGKFGDVGACNNKICTKYYHLGCVGLTSWPEGNKWVCQWHNCNICTKRTTRCCIKCINSFCPPHSKGNVRYDKLIGFVCNEHDPVKETSEINSTKSNIEEGAGTATIKELPENEKKMKDEEFLDSLSLEVRLNGWMTSTPLKKSDSKEEDESVNDSNVKSQDKKGKKRKIEEKSNEKEVVNKVQTTNTANLFNPSEKEVKLNNFTPVKYLRTSRNSSKETADPDRDLPIRKRTRLRCGNTV